MSSRLNAREATSSWSPLVRLHRTCRWWLLTATSSDPRCSTSPPLGSINVHASLLPALRGAAPINWAIARGYRETGVTIMRMVAAMDAGAIIHQVKEPILEDETASGLSVRLSESGAKALLEALTLLSAGGAQEVEQNDEAATFAAQDRQERRTRRLESPATDVVRHVRAMDAVPGAWSMLGGHNVKLFRPHTVPHHVVAPPLEPGTVLAVDPAQGVLVATPDGGVLITEVQPAGKRRMQARDWINGRGVEQGQRFE